MTWEPIEADAYMSHFDRTLEELRRIGKGDGFDLLGQFRAYVPWGHPLERLVNVRLGLERSFSPAIENLDASLGRVRPAFERVEMKEWLTQRLTRAWDKNHGIAHGSIAELNALGTLIGQFPEIAPVKERPEPTPDFRVGDGFTVEVYAPNEAEDCEIVLSPEGDRFRMAISYPITGRSERGRAFPALKLMDRLLNNKVEGRQVLPNIPGVLFVDISLVWAFGAALTGPSVTTQGQGLNYLGTSGIWHAFYGESGRVTLAGERTSTEHMPLHRPYAQEHDGFFRRNPEWAAAILWTNDGAVIFESPWTSRPLNEATIRRFIRLPKCRLEHGWLRGPQTTEQFQSQVEAELKLLEWLLEREHAGHTHAAP